LDGELPRDIVFNRGELHGITRFSKNLFKFNIGVNKDDAPVVAATHRMDVRWILNVPLVLDALVGS
jgi:hypothetical protein